MNKQRGFLYVMGALGIALVSSMGLNAYLWVRIDNVQLQAENFEIQVESKGEIAKEKKEKTDFWNRENSRIADEKLKDATDNNVTLIAELRNQSNLASRRLPGVPTDSKSPGLYCADRKEFERRNGESFSKLREEARAIADRGTENSIRLDSACTWAIKIK